MIQWFLNLFQDREFGAQRSPDWNMVRKNHLKEEPICVACKTIGKLLNPIEVHHQLPFHLHPELELQDTNLISLCRKCHLFIGHLNSWSSFNKDVRVDAVYFAQKINQRP